MSALDVSVQSQVLNLLLELQREFEPELPVHRPRPGGGEARQRPGGGDVSRQARRGGECASAIYENPKHAYTKALLSAIPVPDPAVERERILLEGDVPSPIDPPKGSAFGHRMQHPRYEETIGMEFPLVEIEPGHWVAADPCCLEGEDYAKVAGR